MQVSRSAPKEIIKAVYKAWMFALKKHPDVGGGDEDAKLINLAYETLSDDGKRADYDAKLKAATTSSSQEKRRAPRYAISATVMCLPEGAKDWFEARVLDASVAGLRIECGVKIEKGSRLLISFPCSARSAVETKVAWIKTQNKKYSEAGVEFFSPISDVLRRLGYGSRRA